MTTEAEPALIGSDWVDWWTPSEAQVQWQAAAVEYQRKRLVLQAELGGYVRLAQFITPPASAFDVDIVDPDPTREEVEAKQREALGSIEPLRIPGGDWTVLDEDDPEDVEITALFNWLDRRFPMGWDWIDWLDRCSSEGAKFLDNICAERPEFEEYFLDPDEDC